MLPHKGGVFMRAKINPQRSIFETHIDHTISKELKAISDRLDRHPECLDWLAEDLGTSHVKDTGNKGMSLENILRAAIIKAYTGYSYRKLEFAILDSFTFQTFTRMFNCNPKYSTLQTTIMRISSETWEKINRALLHDAVEEKIEKGRKIRIDSTVVETNIHRPSDSSLLWDSVRVMTRLLQQAEDIWGKRPAPYQNHTRVCKKLARRITFRCKKEERPRFYRKLLTHAQNVKQYLIANRFKVFNCNKFNTEKEAWVCEVDNILGLVTKVIDQTKRRVFNNEKVPSKEKIVSLFESHTDIIKKGGRNTQYGHKINFTSGQSALIMDAVIEKGNPSDRTRALPMVMRQAEIYGRPPRQVAFDGGYASKKNGADIKEAGVKDVAFHKKAGIKVLELVKSPWVYDRLKAFRAGIEATIGTLKTRYSLSRLKTKGFENFKVMVQCSVVVYNLVTLAKLTMSNQ